MYRRFSIVLLLLVPVFCFGQRGDSVLVGGVVRDAFLHIPLKALVTVMDAADSTVIAKDVE